MELLLVNCNRLCSEQARAAVKVTSKLWLVVLSPRFVDIVLHPLALPKELWMAQPFPCFFYQGS